MKLLLPLAILMCPVSALADEIVVEDAFVRVARPGAPTAAAFMTIRNNSKAADRLVSAASPVADRVELHTHIEQDGLVRMRPLEDGITLPIGATHTLVRGKDHVMMMDLSEPLKDGGTVLVTLTFEIAGDVEILAIVDNNRGQSGHKH